MLNYDHIAVSDPQAPSGQQWVVVRIGTASPSWRLVARTDSTAEANRIRDALNLLP